MMLPTQKFFDINLSTPELREHLKTIAGAQYTKKIVKMTPIHFLKLCYPGPLNRLWRQYYTNDSDIERIKSLNIAYQNAILLPNPVLVVSKQNKLLFCDGTHRMFLLAQLGYINQVFPVLVITDNTSDLNY